MNYLKKWILSINTNGSLDLLLILGCWIVKHINFLFFWCNIYTEIIFSNFLNDEMRLIVLQVIKHNGNFLISTKIKITVLMCKSSIFSSDVIMIVWIYFTFFKLCFTNPIVSRIFKIFMVFFSHNNVFIKFCLNFF